MERYMKGMSQVEISKELQISPELVSLDLKHIREESKKSLNNIVERELPLAFTKARRSLQFIQKEALKVWEHAKTDQMKLSALHVFGEAQEKEFELVSNSHVLDEALRFVSSDHINKVLEHLNDKEREENSKPNV
jgi:hypothetical protein